MPPPDPHLILLQQEDGSWCRLADPQGVVAANTVPEVLPALAEIERATRAGLFAAGFIAYEAAPAFDPHLRVHASADRPLLWFQLGRRLVPDQRVRPPAPPAPPWQPEWTEAGYAERLRRIRDWIAAGDTYQVNFTYRQTATLTIVPEWPWLHLPLAQPRGLGAYLATPEFVIASASPELFFERHGQRVRCRPMKGTAARGRWVAEDRAAGHALSTSAKNRAENLMITDMVRNDLGRVARPGSVQVRDLFAVERFPTVWQMTSTVEAETAAPLTELLRALFPSASVTGAPKVRTMEIIHDLETSPRGVYTGAVGWVGPGGDARLNVAIRTVWLDRTRGVAEYGAGSGVVWDSDPASEYTECRDKTRVLDWTPPAFELLETLAWRPGAGYELLAGHLDRLGESADYFSFRFDRTVAAARLAEAAGAWSTPQRVRLRLAPNGAVHVDAAPLPPPATAPWRLAWAADPVSTREVRLYHKTTDRQIYEQARAGRPGVDDVLLWNERGELCEATIANVALRVGDDWYTPPIDSGLLPGVLRRQLLESGRLRERVLRRDELTPASELALFNSVRGWWPARLL